MIQTHERWREPISTLPSPEHLAAKENEGWSPIASEWAREPQPSAEEAHQDQHPIPYGLRISADCSHLEVDPIEKEVMTLVIAMIAGDHPLSKIAAELNQREFRPRRGTEWTQVSIFKLLPRIVEFGPEIMSQAAWSSSKKDLLAAIT